jgi:hypothetical protein
LKCGPAEGWRRSVRTNVCINEVLQRVKEKKTFCINKKKGG